MRLFFFLIFLFIFSHSLAGFGQETTTNPLKKKGLPIAHEGNSPSPSSPSLPPSSLLSPSSLPLFPILSLLPLSHPLPPHNRKESRESRKKAKKGSTIGNGGELKAGGGGGEGEGEEVVEDEYSFGELANLIKKAVLEEKVEKGEVTVGDLKKLGDVCR